MPLPPTLRSGPAGWSQPAGRVHPLEFLARHFDTVEIDATLRPELSRLWLKKVAHNPNFAFTVRKRILEERAPEAFREALRPFLKAGKLGCLVLEFPSTNRFTGENRDRLIQLRRAFHEFPLVAEVRHESWLREEAQGTLIDYHVGFSNSAETALLTSPIGYLRLEGGAQAQRNIDRLKRYAESAYVIVDSESVSQQPSLFSNVA